MTLPKRTKLGLEDPRVIKCFDRGEEFSLEYQNHVQGNRASHGTTSSTPGCAKALDVIHEQLESAVKTYPPESTKFFIPRDKLSEIMTPDNVLSVINTLSCCSALSPDRKKSLHHDICFGPAIGYRKPCNKILAALIGSELQEELVSLVEEGTDDSCLPFKCHSDGRNTRCQNPSHSHEAINKLGWTRRKIFCDWAYAVVALYLKRPPERHAHYILDHNDILPIVQQRSQEPTKPRSIPQRQGNNEANSERNYSFGGFSHVLRVRFHPGHFNFGSGLVSDVDYVYLKLTL
jgi:hypothetical protein